MHAIVRAATAHAPSTRVTVDSFREHHPGARVTVVVCDPLAPPGAVEGADVVSARDLVIGTTPDGTDVRCIDAWLAGGAEFTRWAVVPAAIDAAAPDDRVLVLPGGAVVLGPLDDLLTASDAPLALAPRVFDAAAAVGNGGWVPDVAVVDPGASALLAEWRATAVAALLDPHPVVDPEDPWAAFATSGAAVGTLADPGIRVSPRSVAALDLDLDGDVVTADRVPVRLVQFPAFDPARRWWYSTGPDDEPAVLVSSSPALRRLCDDQAARLTGRLTGREASTGLSDTVGDDGSDEPETDAGSTAVGVIGGPALRRAVRAALRAAVAAGEPPPNPFDPATADRFFDWLRGNDGADLTGVSIAADVVWATRPDLATVFPNVAGRDREGFVRWLWTHGLAEGVITTACLPPMWTPAPAPDAAPAPSDAQLATTAAAVVRDRVGVNLIGYHDSDLGLGVAVRRVGAALDAAGVPWAKVSYGRTHSRRRGSDDGSAGRADAPWPVNLVLIAPDQLHFLHHDLGPEMFADRYEIGLWYWETDVLTPGQRAALDLVDEVWGSTQYLVDVFAAHTDKPVVHVPVPLEFRRAERDAAERRRLGLDDRFTFLFTFDFFSIAERKNPLGLITAYTRAFGPNDGTRLILKAINGDRHVAQAEEIRAAFADRPDVEMWDRYLDSDDRLALVANVDCYVSLHRSEGLGLTMAEAMAAGTPVIATGYSGNVDFMEGAGLLVRHQLTEIGPGSHYPATGHWAEPDLDHAAELMRRLRDEPALQAELREAGPRALRPFTLKRVGLAMQERLEAIARLR